MLVWLNMSLENGPPPFKLVWGQVFIKVVGMTNFSEKKNCSPLKILVFLSKCHLEPRLPPKRIKVSFFGKHWKFCVQNLLKSSSYIHFKNTKQFNIHTHRQLTLVKMQQLPLTFITIQIWTLMQRPTACNVQSIICASKHVPSSFWDVFSSLPSETGSVLDFAQSTNAAAKANNPQSCFWQHLNINIASEISLDGIANRATCDLHFQGTWVETVIDKDFAWNWTPNVLTANVLNTSAGFG